MKPKLALIGILAVLAGLFALPAQAQIICSQFGNFTYCDPGTGQGSIQADLGHGRGVILDSTNGTTTPYTILQPQSQRHTAPVFIPRSTPRARSYSEPDYEPSYSAAPSAPLGYLPPPPSGYLPPPYP